jgi:F-type H+-transporting ATPase subunit delta
MSRSAVARNYADTLLDLAGREEAGQEYLRMIGDVAGLYATSTEFRMFVESPRIPIAEKREAIRAGFGERYPAPFVRFLLVVMEKRRQGLLPEIEEACRELLDQRTGRVNATVTLTVEPDPELRREIEASLSRVLGREVTADFSLDSRLLGGMIVRVEDCVLDGSLRRRLQLLRRTLIEEGSSARAAG